ncbi:MAG: O-antigen ligase family protein [Deltaproteobacteria bacterium]|nr:O-antigen ligase family protein [Deltaproteobacteria bacterium]
MAIAAVVLFVGLFRMRAAVYVWIVLVGLLTPPLYTLRSGTVRVGAVILGGLLIESGLRRRKSLSSLRASRLAVPLGVLTGIAVLSCAQGILFYDPNVAGSHRQLAAEIYATLLYGLSVAACILVATQIDSRTALERACMAILIAGVATLFVKDAVPIPWWPLLVTHGTALIYAGLLFAPPKSLRVQTAACGLVVFAVVEVIGQSFFGPSTTQWVSGWIVLGGTLIVITAIRFGWRLLPVALVLGAVGAVAFQGQLQRMVEIARQEGDLLRYQLWIDAFRVMSHRPLLGVGPGNYLDYVLSYGANAFSSAHGNYQQVVAETGVLGLAALTWVLWRSFGVAWKLYRRTDDPILRAVTVGIIGALAGVAAASVVGDYLIPVYHNGGHTTFTTTVYTWIMMGLLVTIEGLLERVTPAISKSSDA